MFDVFAPSREDIEETHGRWLEREPGIFERADWDEGSRTLSLSVRRDEAETTFGSTGSRRPSGCGCSTRPASRSRRSTAGSTAAPRRTKRTWIFVCPARATASGRPYKLAETGSARQLDISGRRARPRRPRRRGRACRASRRARPAGPSRSSSIWWHGIADHRDLEHGLTDAHALARPATPGRRRPPR